MRFAEGPYWCKARSSRIISTPRIVTASALALNDALELLISRLITNAERVPTTAIDTDTAVRLSELR
jgi:hypothetical protein